MMRRGMMASPVPFNPAVLAYSTPTSMLPCDSGGHFVGSPGVRPKCVLANKIATGDVSLDEVNATLNMNFQSAQDAHDRLTPGHMVQWVLMPPGRRARKRKFTRWTQDLNKHQGR